MPATSARSCGATASGSVVLTTLKDGYYLVVSLDRRVLPAVAARHCLDARTRLDEEL